MPDKKTILLVEDDETLLTTLSSILEQNNFRVITARDGELGLALAKEEHPDIALLDIMVPKLDGVALLKKLREDEHLKDIPVMMLTNRDDIETVSDSLKGGAFDYIVKHEWRLEDIAKKIKQRLGVE